MEVSYSEEIRVKAIKQIMPLNSFYIWYLHGVEYLLKLLGAIIPRRRFFTLTFTAHVSP